jgi:hypothetical protein
LRFEDPSIPAVSAPLQGIEARSRFEAYGHSSLPPAMPIRVTPGRAHTFRPSVAPAPAPQKLLYSCPLCPRDFQLPNGLALHLKWHDRVGRLEANLASHMSHRPQDRVPPKNPRMELGTLEARDASHAQLHNNQRNTMAGFSTASYMAPQSAYSAQVESVSRPLGCMFVVSFWLTRYSRTPRAGMNSIPPVRFRTSVSPKSAHCFTTCYSWITILASR